MIRNVGDTDRRVRIVVGTAIMMLGAMQGQLSSLVGLYPLVTGVYAYCPLYKLLKMDSLDQNKPKK